MSPMLWPRAVVATTLEWFGRLDVLVYNAGYANIAAIEDVALDDFCEQCRTRPRLMNPVVESNRAKVAAVAETPE